MEGEVTIQGWGRQGVQGREIFSEDLDALTRDVPLSRGLGRSYGDASLPPPSRAIVANTTLANRILAFDAATGTLTAEAGLSLMDLNAVMTPKGFFPPVTPGTQFVTLGGMVASDVHGKNHHVSGTFGRHVDAIRLRVASGEILTCSRTEHPELFFATLGGMGLTGHVLDVTFRMEAIPSPWIYQETERLPNIDAIIEGLQSAAKDWPMTMAWMDSLVQGDAMGRGILYRGRWATPDEAPQGIPRRPLRIPIPFDFPNFLLNPLTMRFRSSIMAWVPGRMGTSRAMEMPGRGKERRPSPSGPQSFTTTRKLIP